MATITTRSLQSARPRPVPYFIRDDKVTGFAAKVNPSGSVQLIAEVRHNGRTVRKTIGQYPYTDIKEARQLAISFIHQVKTDQLGKPSSMMSLEDLFNKYTTESRLKMNTIKNYRHVILFYLSDWLQQPVASITKQMVEQKFYEIRDKGIAGGKPTYSQATKTMRILSALMNYAMADELIENNPVQVLKLKRVDRSIKKRTNYLPAIKVRELLEKSSQDSHPVTLAVHLMIYAGLRKNEALRLKWDHIELVEDVRCIIVKETKNSRPHYVPITQEIQKILERAYNKTAYIFPSKQIEGSCVTDERPTIKRLSRLIEYEFRCHDLRRTFATRASEVGIDYLTIKRLLNHKSNDITAQYIQWHSRENLTVMKSALEKIQY
jgi:integrase